METSIGAPRISPPPFEQHAEKIKQRLLQNGVYPTPKIIHTLRKKGIQKSLRKSKRLSSQSLKDHPPLSDSQKQTVAEEFHFETIIGEYKDFKKAIKAKTKDGNGALMVGNPWERLERTGLRQLLSGTKEFGGDKLKTESLRELSEMFEKRKQDGLKWVLDDDVEVEDGWLDKESRRQESARLTRSEVETIRFLVDRLSATELSVKDWKFSRMMKQSGLQFTENQLLKIVETLGSRHWRHALSVVEWVYNDKERKCIKSRFVYTKLLAVLGKARKPHEALHIFGLMREDCHIYPDMAAYHTIAVTLGQAGLLKELVNIIDCLRQKPTKKLKNMHRKDWDRFFEPDVVVYNAVLNACAPSCQWKGVSWVFEQLRKSGLKPNGATYGLAMEVMLQSGKYDLVHEYFQKMKKSGEALKAITYKVLIRAFWEEGKVDEAVEAARDMERKGVVGTASVYYELACCLCNKGRWQDALMEVETLKKLPHVKPLEVTFTGMILSSIDGGFIDGCISIFEHMKDHCPPNIGTINAMLKVYGRNDMFSNAKELFEDTKKVESGSLIPDIYTYTSMLRASASALQWEYFEYIYKEMILHGYQLDQTKHASLLVEASRGGKTHLLEHAMESILEGGEIPHPSFFTEMVCQATTRCDYERAVALVKTMDHAPFQVSEKQWTELFEKNGDRISRDGFAQLLDSLGNFDESRESTVSNLSRSLRALCASGIAFGNEDELILDGKKSFNRQGSTVGMVSSGGSTEFLVKKLFLSENSMVDVNEVELDKPTSEIDEAPKSDSPSGHEILEAWKESMKIDGILFPFQHGRTA